MVSFCAKCGQGGQFRERPGTATGLRTQCKRCDTADTARWRRNNQARAKRNQDTYRAANPNKIREWSAAFYAKNRDGINARMRERYAAGDRFRRLAHGQNRRALMHGSGKVTTEQWCEILEVFDGRCAYCLNRSDSLTMDHVIALSRGGSHCPDNVVPACKSCNSKKGAKPVFSVANTATDF